MRVVVSFMKVLLCDELPSEQRVVVVPMNSELVQVTCALAVVTAPRQARG